MCTTRIEIHFLQNENVGRGTCEEIYDPLQPLATVDVPIDNAQRTGRPNWQSKRRSVRANQRPVYDVEQPKEHEEARQEATPDDKFGVPTQKQKRIRTLFCATRPNIVPAHWSVYDIAGSCSEYWRPPRKPKMCPRSDMSGYLSF